MSETLQSDSCSGDEELKEMNDFDNWDDNSRIFDKFLKKRILDVEDSPQKLTKRKKYSVLKYKPKIARKENYRAEAWKFSSEDIVLDKPVNSAKIQISKTPYKVLDAPALKDDYYLNLLDWSNKDLLGVGLDRQ